MEAQILCFTDLPADMLHEIAERLDPASALSFALIARYFFAVLLPKYRLRGRAFGLSVCARGHEPLLLWLVKQGAKFSWLEVRPS